MNQPLHSVIVTPQGERYNNLSNSGLVMNSEISIEDFKYTNRIGVVKTLPLVETPLKVGDKVIVHHNVFRQFWNVQGHLRDGQSYIDGTDYSLDPTMVFAFYRDSKWTPLNDWCFVKPVIQDENALIFNTDKFKSLKGTIFINNPILANQGVQLGDEIGFTPQSEYEFEIDDQLVYKMKVKDILFKL